MSAPNMTCPQVTSLEKISGKPAKLGKVRVTVKIAAR